MYIIKKDQFKIYKIQVQKQYFHYNYPPIKSYFISSTLWNKSRHKGPKLI